MNTLPIERVAKAFADCGVTAEQLSKALIDLNIQLYKVGNNITCTFADTIRLYDTLIPKDRKFAYDKEKPVVAFKNGEYIKYKNSDGYFK